VLGVLLTGSKHIDNATPQVGYISGVYCIIYLSIVIVINKLYPVYDSGLGHQVHRINILHKTNVLRNPVVENYADTWEIINAQ